MVLRITPLLLVSGLLLFANHSAYAQLLENDTLRWSYGASVNGSIITGNVERKLIRTEGYIKHNTPRWGLASSNTYIYGTIRKRKTEDDIFSKNFLYLVPGNRLYPYVMGWLESNFRRRIDFRYQVGPGLTAVLFRKEQHVFKASLTGIYENTHFADNRFRDRGILEDRRIKTIRARIRLYGFHQLKTTQLQLVYEVWFQQSVEDTDNYRGHVEASLSVPVYKKLRVRSTLDYSYERLVVAGIRREDVIWTFGLSYQYP